MHVYDSPAMAIVHVCGSYVPGIDLPEAMARLQGRCIRELGRIAEIDAVPGGFTVNSRLGWEELERRLICLAVRDFRGQAQEDWPMPSGWFDLK
jgi:hypothetical protein